ncbi:MAG: hypothetical protein OHK0011_16090 [Turneriella sp.]
MGRVMAVLLTLVILAGTLSAADSDPATKGDLRQMMQLMEKRLEQMERRFDQMEKRFEQIDKRLDDLKYYMTGLIGLATAALGYLILRVMRQEDRLSRLVEH